MKKILFILAMGAATLTNAQSFIIRKVELAGEKINLYYDLLDADVSRTYTITVFNSKDNFISPLQKLTGDAGLEIKPGGNKKITWNALEELGKDFDGEVALEIRGRIYIPFVRLDGLQTKFKRGVGHELTWTGGTQQNILNFDLYKGDEKITSFPNIANVGHYTMVLPTTVKPGTDYRLKITDSKNKDQIVNSQPFRVKRKIPLLAKVIPVALIGGAVVLLAPSKAVDNSIKPAPSPDDEIK